MYTTAALLCYVYGSRAYYKTLYVAAAEIATQLHFLLNVSSKTSSPYAFGGAYLTLSTTNIQLVISS